MSTDDMSEIKTCDERTHEEYLQDEIDELRDALQATEKAQQQHAETVLWQAGRIAELIDENERLRTAAQAVIDRWDTPHWKDVPATAEYVGRLRAALEK